MPSVASRMKTEMLLLIPNLWQLSYAVSGGYTAICRFLYLRRLSQHLEQGEILFYSAGFPKKLLVAISIVTVIAMCLRPAEAAPLEHRSRDNMSKLTKDRTASHRPRHQHGSTAQSTKESRMSLTVDPYEKERTKIERRVAYMKHNFDDGRKNLTEPRDYGSGMTAWLPKTNFVNIHFQYKKMTRKQMKYKRLFTFHIQRLYKSLRKYYELFKIFRIVQVSEPDQQIIEYNEKRELFLQQTTLDLYTAIADMGEFMDRYNISKSDVSSKHAIEKTVNGAQYLKNDEILLRSYGNLLANWYLELNCSDSKLKHKQVTTKKCIQYERNLRRKKNKRRHNEQKHQES